MTNIKNINDDNTTSDNSVDVSLLPDKFFEDWAERLEEEEKLFWSLFA